MVGRSVESERQTDVHMACAPNRRLAKIHRSNPVAAVTTLYGRRRNTGREGMWRGRRMTDDNRPAQMLGCAMAARHRARQLKPPRPCRPGALYGVRCRIQRDPVGGTVEYQPVTAALGNPMGIQSSPRSRDDCRVNPARPHPVRGTLTATVPEGVRRVARNVGPLREPLLTTTDVTTLGGHARWPVATDRELPTPPGIERDVTKEDASRSSTHGAGHILRIRTTMASSCGRQAPSCRVRQIAGPVSSFVCVLNEWATRGEAYPLENGSEVDCDS